MRRTKEQIKREKLIRLDRPKKPRLKHKHVGVEIEFFCPHNEDVIKDALIEAGVDKYCELKEDGSIQPGDENEIGNREHAEGCGAWDCCGGDQACSECSCGQFSSELQGHELAICATEKLIPEVIDKICVILESLKAEVNSSCGLHVHLDMRHRDAKKAWLNLTRNQALMYSMVPKSRLNSDYCRPSPVWVPLSHGAADRYSGINPQALEHHKTLEVRLHSGTVDAEKIKNWVKIVSKLSDTPKIIKNLSELRDHFDKDLYDYIKARLVQFENEHKDYSFLNEKSKLLADVIAQAKRGFNDAQNRIRRVREQRRDLNRQAREQRQFLNQMVQDADWIELSGYNSNPNVSQDTDDEIPF